MRLETVHVIPEGERLKIAYPKRGTLVLETVDVGAPLKVEAVVNLDGRRTAVVLATDAGPRVIVVDTASNEVTAPERRRHG